MDIKEIINWQALSRFLALNDESVRRNKCPKKYQRRVDVLIYVITRWGAWAKRKECKN